VNRRGFFATLLAPLVARCLPKAKPAYRIGVDLAVPGYDAMVFYMIDARMQWATARMNEILARTYLNGQSSTSKLYSQEIFDLHTEVISRS